MKSLSNKIKFIAIVFSLLLAASFCFAIKPATASAETAGQDVVIAENYKSVDDLTAPEATLDGSKIYQKSNVIQGPVSTFGIVTGDSWGAYVSGGNGYVVYKISADEGYVFGDTTMTFSGFHGHQNLTECYGASNSDIRVSVSEDGQNYTMVYSIAMMIDGDWVTSKEYSDVPVNVNYLIKGLDKVFIKIDLIQREASDLPSTILQDDKVALGQLAVRLYDVNIVASQKKIISGTSYVTVNYGTKNAKTVSVLNGEKFGGLDYIPAGFTKANDKLYLDKDCTIEYSANKVVNGDLVLYVKGDYEHYSVNYQLDGGKNPSSNSSVYYTQEGLSLDIPSRAGYVFLGWYTEETFTNKVEAISQGTTGDITLYAKWQKIDNSASWNVDNGNIDNGNVDNGGCGSSVNELPVILGGLALVAGAYLAVKRLKKSK